MFTSFRPRLPMTLPIAAVVVFAVLVALLLGWARPARAACEGDPAARLQSVALFYGEQVPVEQLSHFGAVVVEPDSGFVPPAQDASCQDWYAYVSVGEVTHDRSYARDVPKKWLIGHNATWASTVVDQAAPGWPAFFVERVIAPLWARGFRGFFLDTLDSYQLAAKTDTARAKQQAGLVAVIRAVKARYPDAKLILNRGFEILPQVHDEVAAVAFESLYGNWDQRNQRYGEVPANDRDWLLAQAKTIREQYGLPVISIDYCAPGDDACSRAIVEKIRAAGIVPYVTDGALRTVGAGPTD